VSFGTNTQTYWLCFNCSRVIAYVMIGSNYVEKEDGQTCINTFTNRTAASPKLPFFAQHWSQIRKLITYTVTINSSSGSHIQQYSSRTSFDLQASIHYQSWCMYDVHGRHICRQAWLSKLSYRAVECQLHVCRRFGHYTHRPIYILLSFIINIQL
jgi:hypothetical protein